MKLQERLAAAKNHYSHPSFLIGQWEPLGSEWPIMNEYLAGCAVTLIFATALYFILSSFSYFIFYVWFKGKYTPKQQQLKFEKESYFHDLKWSALNILGQTPLVNLIKIGYPYFSKVQYSFEFQPIFLFYLLLHIVYDQFLTYWFHRLLHHPKIYQHLHIFHHVSKAVTPFTGFAFHPLDAFIQALPVFTSCYFIPLPIDVILFHGLLTSLWAISIHDNVNMFPFKGFLYAGSHSIHHYPWGQNYNYGKFTSVCDRLYGSYCDPENITGYGYQVGPKLGSFMNRLNSFYTTLVPDYGITAVSKIRDLYAKKIK